MLYKKYTPLILICFFSCKPVVELPNSFNGQVVTIIDGDTIDILFDNKKERIRLADIDCPEGSQPFGDSATKFVSTLCFLKTVTVKNMGERDMYDRLIATIVVDDSVNVNSELVKAGLAWHYKKYSDKKEYSDMEIEAKNNHLGLWSDISPIAQLPTVFIYYFTATLPNL